MDKTWPIVRVNGTPWPRQMRETSVCVGLSVCQCIGDFNIKQPRTTVWLPDDLTIGDTDWFFSRTGLLLIVLVLSFSIFVSFLFDSPLPLHLPPALSRTLSTFQGRKSPRPMFLDRTNENSLRKKCELEVMITRIGQWGLRISSVKHQS